MPADGGIRFGQYLLLRRIARGGMAEVFLAQQRGLEGFDRRVAVKRILPHLADSPDFVKMFLGEAKLAAQLTHPNIVHLYDFGKVDHDYFLAMEFVDGVHAGQLFKLTERERLPYVLLARIGADAAAALHHAHELRSANGAPLGLVHRDVSPANLMVSYDGVVKLCDFGIAKAAAMTEQKTNPGQVKGKYAYMSPEQTIAAPMDGRSDVYSLAIVMWELITGQTIVPRGDAVAAMRAIRDGKLTPIEKAAPATPAPLAAAITWALETRRERRATAADLAQALEAFIKSSPELATPMQLGAWIRQRFPRDVTGSHHAIAELGNLAPSPGTQVAPGTAATPRTALAEATRVGAVTGVSDSMKPTVIGGPPPVSESMKPTVIGGTHAFPDETAETLAIASDESATLLDDLASHIARRSQRTTVPRPASEDPSRRAAVEISDVAAGDGSIIVNDTQRDSGEHEATVLRAGTWPVMANTTVSGDTAVVPPASPGFIPRTAAAAPTMIDRARTPTGAPPEMPSGTSTKNHPLPPGPTDRPSYPQMSRRRTPFPTETESTLGVRRAPARSFVWPIAGLVGLAVLSFVIVLAARSPSGNAPADAPAVAAATPDAAGARTAPDGATRSIVLDAAPQPTITPDADRTTYLEIHTTPPGATITVNGSSRVADAATGARFVLAAGRYPVVAELDGWQTERREVDLDLTLRDHVVQDIVFAHRMAHPGPPVPQVGRLAISTNPYSDVYIGTRKIGQTPFDIEYAAGTYTLVFKNPEHPIVRRSVTIAPTKPVKLRFDLP